MADAHEPTKELRDRVKSYVAYGLTQDQICTILSIAKGTLEKHYRFELDTGKMEANAAVAQSLFFNAVKLNNTTAQIFWLKAQAGWRDNTQDGYDKFGNPLINPNAARPDILFGYIEDDDERKARLEQDALRTPTWIEGIVNPENEVIDDEADAA